jgi:hypothetical protein
MAHGKQSASTQLAGSLWDRALGLPLGYSLTDISRSLSPILDAMHRWGSKDSYILHSPRIWSR